ncbi:hypothetical protein H257_18297 [Aphanomyces astaci]|uniref:Uncharacterized protein n=1 Tax=Aphanomyces astaci TaxID=112090 RepID=W4FDF1_APHAT|nr:hypothetical protein H257_18297 [Aphanomyces astaci]ETV64866.1 hypothetical protein H257_18297 [Aphanomyces astaci]|eukprot:XP_009845632.1 hypothetical protein H257_18297 [Aphanomyces astaci]
MALAIKGIAYDYDAMDILARSNERDDYHIVNMSLVYLDETRPTPSLLLFNVADRALKVSDDDAVWGCRRCTLPPQVLFSQQYCTTSTPPS